MADWDKNIELRSDSVKEIIGKTPSWLVRWGTFSFAFVLLLIILGSAWFNYPDRLVSRITISSDQPPVEITAKNDGNLDRLFVDEGQLVKENMVLAELESSVDYEFVIGIDSELDSIRFWLSKRDTSALSSFVNLERPQSGSLKDQYAVLCTALRDYLSYMRLGKYIERISGIQQELLDTKVYYDRLFEQKQLRGKDLKLADKQLERQNDLLDGGAISELEFENSSQVHLAKKLQFEDSRSGLSTVKIEIDKLENQILEYHILDKEENQTLITAIEEKLTSLQGSISEWELNYLFRSPVEGRVSLTRYWTENQKIVKGDRVMSVIQNESQSLIGILELPVIGSGKVARDQKVLVKLDNYPYMEYGMLHGQVNSISIVSDQDFYIVEVSFPEGLKTTYDRQLTLSQGMTGKAEIITDNMSFLVRIINPLRSLISDNQQVK